MKIEKNSKDINWPKHYEYGLRIIEKNKKYEIAFSKI